MQLQSHHGLIGLVILILDIWAIVSTLSSGKRIGEKVMWIVVILMLPVFGFIVWFMVGPKGVKA